MSAVMNDGTTEQPPPTVVDSEASKALVKVGSVLAEFNRLEQRFAELSARHAKVVFPVTTTVGMAQAKEARREFRELRGEVTAVHKTAKAPILVIGKEVDGIKNAFMERVEAVEGPIAEQIRAEETRKELERQAKAEAEAKRVALIQEHLEDIRSLVTRAAGKDAKTIAQFLEEAQDNGCPEHIFQEFVGTAQDLRVKVVTQLMALLTEREAFEAEQLRLAAERIELERQRIAQKEREDALERERQRIVEERRAAQEAAEAAAAAERARIAAERRAAEEEAERKQREREVKFAAEMGRLRAARAENDRIEAERTAAADAEAQENQMRMSEIDAMRHQLFIAGAGRAPYVVGNTLEGYDTLIDEMQRWTVDEEKFGPLVGVAQITRDAVLAKLIDMRATLAQEQEAARIAAATPIASVDITSLSETSAEDSVSAGAVSVSPAPEIAAFPPDAPELLPTSGVTGAVFTPIDALRNNPVAVLRALMTNPHIDLGDLVYQVRDREGLGWEGPAVKAWADAVVAAREILDN